METIRFKQQGDGRKSWVIDEKEIVLESPTNTAHNAMLKEILAEHDYLSIGELSLWLNDEDFGAEATAILNWWISTCKLVAAYVEANPNEENAIDFINTIPKFQ